ncbi:hypothetical protein [Deinococcus humi]|uniref:Uncharacterized protein n=1 Tax=Deinococcus humi TaxID=662880 RepID=A0A7W8JRX3_9DEIO|nr:hypothetical protein [Deinococcus humi]MBB5362090.1 hypothetical protein [Deinococcus humi]GGO22118.1 hypothetical protein GCM10008949_09060 [Deinococcus humi]
MKDAPKRQPRQQTTTRAERAALPKCTGTNQARGEHGVLPMAAIVRCLRDEEGLTAEEVMQRCGMEKEEVTRLYERGGMTERGTQGKESFSKGWTPTRS